MGCDRNVVADGREREQITSIVLLITEYQLNVQFSKNCFQLFSMIITFLQSLFPTQGENCALELDVSF